MLDNVSVEDRRRSLFVAEETRRLLAMLKSYRRIHPVEITDSQIVLVTELRRS